MALQLGTLVIKQLFKKIQQITNKFIRMPFGLHHRASATHLM